MVTTLLPPWAREVPQAHPLLATLHAPFHVLVDTAIKFLPAAARSRSE
jgi:hypothetical protein